MIYHVNDMYIGKALEVFGEFSPGEMDLYRHVLRPGYVVVEVGANIGALTVPLAQCVGDLGRVIAFEPQQLTYYALCGNLALNAITNTTAIRIAVGAEAGTTCVVPLDLTVANNVGALAMDPSGRHNLQVTTLDFYEMSRVDLLKIDVEGMEAEVLRGAEDMVRRCRPVIAVETEEEEPTGRVIEWLVAHEYSLYAHYPPLVKAPEDLNPWPGVVSFNTLAVPNERGQPGASVRKRFGMTSLQE